MHLSATYVGRQCGSLLPGYRVPDPHRLVAAGGEPSAVGGDRHRPHPVFVAGEGGAFLSACRVPDPHSVVEAGGGEPAAVGGDRHRPCGASNRITR
jgi:hypothetical protein